MKIDLYYLHLGNLGGRGGVVRFFMLIHGIAYDETLYDMSSDWPEEKKRLIETGINPAGCLPIVKYDGKTLSQHVAIMRQLAVDAGISSGNFANDAVADEYQSFRDGWVRGAFGGERDEFLKVVAPKLDVLEGLYDQYGEGTYLAADKPLWGDCAVASFIRDLVLTDFVKKEELPPRLAALYQNFFDIPAVAKWCKDK